MSGAIGFSVHSSHFGHPEYAADYNEISNNIIYGVDGAGVYLYDWQDGYSFTHNIVRNNIILDAGLNNYPELPNVAFRVGSAVDPTRTVTGRDNIFEDNIIYRENVSNLVLYRDEAMCVSTLNDQDGSFGDTLKGNVQMDPLFTDPENHDFSFREDSPCRQR
jgi:hypothetical protein